MKDPVPIVQQKVGNWLTGLGWTLMLTGLIILVWPKRLSSRGTSEQPKH